MMIAESLFCLWLHRVYCTESIAQSLCTESMHRAHIWYDSLTYMPVGFKSLSNHLTNILKQTTFWWIARLEELESRYWPLTGLVGPQYKNFTNFCKLGRLEWMVWVDMGKRGVKYYRDSTYCSQVVSSGHSGCTLEICLQFSYITFRQESHSRIYTSSLQPHTGLYRPEICYQLSKEELK